MKLCGTFTSDCDWHPKDYCKGTCHVELDGDAVYHGATGRITIDYDSDSKFQPPIFVPRPLPSMPVTVQRIKGDEFSVLVSANWWSWEKVFDLIGIKVLFSYDPETKEFEGTYSVNGGLGIPKDQGTLRSCEILS